MRYVKVWIVTTAIVVVVGWAVCLYLATCCLAKGDISPSGYIPRYDRYGNEILQWPIPSSIFNESLSWSDCAFFMCSKEADCKEEPWLREIVYTVSVVELTAEISRREAGGLQCCHSLLFILLRMWHGLAQELNIEYMVSYGTLLGAVRAGSLIPWTSDVDIALNKSSHDLLLTRKVREKLWGQGWNLFYQACGRLCVGRGTELAKGLAPDYDDLRPSHRWQAPYVDFYDSFGPSEHSDNCSLMVASERRGEKEATPPRASSTCHYPTSYLFPPSTVLINNFAFPAPAQPLEVLRLDYGYFYNDTSLSREAHGTTCDHGGLMASQNPCFSVRLEGYSDAFEYDWTLIT